MASDIALLIVDPERCAVVLSAWVGMGGNKRSLAPGPAARPGLLVPRLGVLGSICASEALSIMGQHYANGATPDDVQRWIAQYPMARYWWIFDHDY